MQVGLPVPLGVEAERQVDPRELAGETGPRRVDRRARTILVEQLGIAGVGALGIAAQQIENPLRRRRPRAPAPRPWRFVVACAARCSGGGTIEFVVEDRVAGRVFVDVRRAVPDPLPRDKDRQLDVVLDLAHLERRRVTVPHQIVDEPLVLADLAGAAAVGDARRLHDRRIVAHVVDDADKPVIEHRQRLVEDLLQGRHGGAARLADLAALSRDFVLLFRCQPHPSRSS